MRNANTIVKMIGAAAIREACGVSEYSVRAAKRSGSFPASWFDVIDNLCRDAGIECPRAVFNFKESAVPEPMKEAE